MPGGRVNLWRVVVVMKQRGAGHTAFDKREMKEQTTDVKWREEGGTSNSRREGRTGKRTSLSRFSAS